MIRAKKNDFPPDIAGNLQNSQRTYETLRQDEGGFLILSQYLKSIAGIEMPLNQKNLCLMATRLNAIIRKLGVRNYREYRAQLENGPPSLTTEFISVMTTHTTHFFRESGHLDYLKGILPEILAKKSKTDDRELRVWCAAASTGQEPYTILMSILDVLPGLTSWNLKFLATDIDVEALEYGCRGVYRESEISSLPPIYRQKYTKNCNAGPAGSVQISPLLTQMIRFATFNLVQKRYPFQHPFDIIFCRNVLIYFDASTACGVVNLLAESLRPGGHLFLGHSESGTMRTPLLRPVAPAVYIREPGRGSK